MSGAAAAFVDRDGVLNELVPDPVSGLPESPLRAADVALVPGAAGALRRLVEAGWRLIGVSNQPAAAKGAVSLAELVAVQDRVAELLAGEGVVFDDFQLCLHHPEGVVPDLARSCECRKPAPGMLLTASERLRLDLSRSWMIGDTDADVAAGRAAGCATILVEYRGSAHKRSGLAEPDHVAGDLASATEIVLRSKE